MSGPVPRAAEAAPAPVRVLYIDDDPGLGRLAQKHLARLGLEVTLATSAEAGLARLRAGAVFDAIALDHYMPGKTGLEALALIQALPDPPPVIFVTGADEGRIAVAALKAGAADYVIKDVAGVFLDLLHAAIGQALAQRRLRREKEAADAAMRAARDRAELLLREVNHRVANSLQLVASLVSMQAATVQDPAAREALIETQGRIAAIAQVHRRLYTSDDVRFVELDAYLASLVQELEEAVAAAGRRHRLLLEAEPVAVSTDKAVALGVIVTELVTNAMKYAYPASRTGDIRVRLAHRPEGTVELAVEDDGTGWRGEAPARGSGLGTQVVRAMAASLKAQLLFDPAHRGTRVVLSFSS
ncbi:sensor histidine kinase [Benzoatithermus flavus]|uniref:histidine kinase n=1 Tax=Benzoatithermus flavus TaxID=3108223 RepID=A0ABU8XY42_9PROT